MTQAAIQEQVNTIKAATKKALRSKESTQKFLVDAGIIEEKELSKDTKKKKK
ncbi:hypothetical protein [Puia dinghuensis]|uniref:Uncharacterized protein n=1 Tax=Puia dinghuensis TaxID=1792502 RepID=A0A8J2UG38_9BACT|nr:hypothetical protein [Puia dinghuensis]GGB10865.1 hypothetical protein GCM10011511_38040 [Puia dinghuensis]